MPGKGRLLFWGHSGSPCHASCLHGTSLSYASLWGTGGVPVWWDQMFGPNLSFVGDELSLFCPPAVFVFSHSGNGRFQLQCHTGAAHYLVPLVRIFPQPPHFCSRRWSGEFVWRNVGSLADTALLQRLHSEQSNRCAVFSIWLSLYQPFSLASDFFSRFA